MSLGAQTLLQHHDNEIGIHEGAEHGLRTVDPGDRHSSDALTVTCEQARLLKHFEADKPDIMAGINSLTLT